MKFFVKDEEGNKFEVEEVKEETIDSTKDEDDLVLTPEEIGALKKLAAASDKIMELLVVKEEVSDEDGEEEIIKKEEVVDTDVDEDDEHDKVTDSKKSVGAIQKKIIARDHAEDIQDEISVAWQKRYGGNR